MMELDYGVFGLPGDDMRVDGGIRGQVVPQNGQGVLGIVLEGSRQHDEAQTIIINHLRNDGHLICSCGGINGGYWMAENLNDIQEFINKELRSRAYDMLKTAQRMEHSAIAQFGSQIQFI